MASRCWPGGEPTVLPYRSGARGDRKRARGQNGSLSFLSVQRFGRRGCPFHAIHVLRGRVRAENSGGWGVKGEAGRTQRLLLQAQGRRSGCSKACPRRRVVLGVGSAGGVAGSASGPPPQVPLSGSCCQPLLEAPGLLSGLRAAPRPGGHGELCVLQYPGLPR